MDEHEKDDFQITIDLKKITDEIIYECQLSTTFKQLKKNTIIYSNED